MKGFRYFMRNFTATAVKEHLRSQFEDTGGRPELTPREVELLRYVRTAGSPPRLEVRLARHTNRLEDLVRFYRDGLGLPELGRFEGHDGYDGAFFALPGTNAHLEFTSGGPHEPPAAHPETLLVLYLGDDDAVNDAVGRTGTEPVEAANPYWNTRAVTLSDPDGFRVVLVPERGPGT